MPDDGLSVDIETSGTTLRPIDDAAGDPRCRSHGAHHRRHAPTSVSAAAPSRWRPGASSTSPTACSRYRIRTASRRRRAPASASTERSRRRPRCSASDALRDSAGLALDPATSRGTVAAQVDVDVPVGKNAAERSRDLHHHRRPDQFRRRQAADRPEGRGVVAAGERRPTTATRSRATSRSTARRPRSI